MGLCLQEILAVGASSPVAGPPRKEVEDEIKKEK